MVSIEPTRAYLPTTTMSEIEAMIPNVDGRASTITISVAFGCPFDGPVAIGDVARLAARAAAAGAHEVALGDTIGVAVPAQIEAMISAIRSITDVSLRCHFHDTREHSGGECGRSLRRRS